MATHPIDPIAEEIEEILRAHPELQQRFDELERDIAQGTVTGHTDEEVAHLLGFVDELEDESR